MLDIVSKNPQVKHIAADVSQSAVHEHRSQQRHPNDRWARRVRDFSPFTVRHFNRRWQNNVLAGGDLFGDYAPTVSEFGVGHLVNKYQHIDRQKEVSHVGGGCDPAIVIANWKKHLY